ncbi:hypothetical protein HDE_11254 [Halotydeus destructor]|nr:hypothetical protein HDE_11254 [Halotydeus destructor]
MTDFTDAELNKKSKKCCERLTENLYIIGNEPTLACYRIQEHVHKSAPVMLDKGREMRKVSKVLKSTCDGLDYSIKAITAMKGSRTHLQNISELLTNSLFFKQQLDFERQRSQSRISEPAESPTETTVQAESSQQSTSAQSVPLRPRASTSRSRFAERLSGSFDLLTNLTFSSLTKSSSSDFKDLKSVFSQMTSSQSSNVRKSRTESSATASERANVVIEDEEEQEAS